MLEPCWNVLRYLEDLAGKWCPSSLMVMYLSWSSLSRELYPSGLSQTGYWNQFVRNLVGTLIWVAISASGMYLLRSL